MYGTDSYQKLLPLIRAVYEDRIAKAFNKDSVARMAEVYPDLSNVRLESYFEEVDFEGSGEEELLDFYYKERRKFEADFMKKHMTNVRAASIARWLGGDAAAEREHESVPDSHHLLMMKALGADTDVQGIRI
jgi:hypothetical protein